MRFDLYDPPSGNPNYLFGVTLFSLYPLSVLHNMVVDGSVSFYRGFSISFIPFSLSFWVLKCQLPWQTELFWESSVRAAISKHFTLAVPLYKFLYARDPISLSIYFSFTTLFGYEMYLYLPISRYMILLQYWLKKWYRIVCSSYEHWRTNNKNDLKYFIEVPLRDRLVRKQLSFLRFLMVWLFNTIFFSPFLSFYSSFFLRVLLFPFFVCFFREVVDIFFSFRFVAGILIRQNFKITIHLTVFSS